MSFQLAFQFGFLNVHFRIHLPGGSSTWCFIAFNLPKDVMAGHVRSQLSTRRFGTQFPAKSHKIWSKLGLAMQQDGGPGLKEWVGACNLFPQHLGQILLLYRLLPSKKPGGEPETTGFL